MSTRQRDAGGRFTKGGGQSLGTATATILLAADKFADGARIVQKVSMDAGKSVDGLAGALGRAKKAAGDFDNSNLGKVQQQIKGVRDQLALVSAAAAGIGAVGIKVAQDFATIRKSVELLSGSLKNQEKIYADIRKMTDKFNVPFDEAIEGANAFIPIANQAGIAVEELVKSAIRFQAYAPRKSFDEIKFSINEALSGDFTSVKDLLDLSTKQREDLKKILKDQGQGALLEELNKILEERGFTDENLIELGESGANAFKQIRSEIKETMAQAFEPLLKNFVIPIMKGFRDWLKDLRENRGGLLQIAAGVTAIVAAGAPLLTFISAAIAGFKAMKMAAAAVSLPSMMGGKAGVLAKGGLAIAGGVMLGTTVATGLANAGVESGDLKRIKNGEGAGAILSERLNQILFIVINGFLEFGRMMAEGALRIRAVLEGLAAVFKLGGSLISQVFNQLKEAIGNILVALANSSLKDVVDTTELRNTGQSSIDEAKKGIEDAITARNEAIATLAKGFVPTDAEVAEVRAGTQKVKDDLLSGLNDILFPMKSRVIDTFEQTADAVKDAMTDTEEYLKQQAEEVAGAQKKFNEANTAAEAKRLEDLTKLNEDFSAEQIQIAKDRVKAETEALANLNADLAKMSTDLTREEEKTEREKARKAIELQVEFARDELIDAEKHADKLIKIRADYEKRSADALENFDFAALFDLSEELKAQTDGANEELEKQRDERLKALGEEREDLVRHWAAEKDERNIKLAQDQSDRQAAYEIERNRITTESAEKMTLAQQAHASELIQIRDKYAAEQQMRVQAHQSELSLLMQSERERARIIGEAQAALLAQAYGFMSGIRSGGTGSTGSRNGSLPTQGGSGSQSPSPTQNRNTPAPGPRGGSSTGPSQNRGGTSNTPRDRLPGRMFGGTVLRDNAYAVNEPRPGFGPERFARGMQMYELPNDLGVFMPHHDGTIKPTPSKPSMGAPQIIVNIHNPVLSNLVDVNMLETSVQRGVQTGLSDWMEQFER